MHGLLGTGVFNSDGDMWKYVDYTNIRYSAQCKLIHFQIPPRQVDVGSSSNIRTRACCGRDDELRVFLLITFYFGNAVSGGLDVTAVDCLLSFDDILFEWQSVRVCCGCLKARGMAVGVADIIV